jgi:hypothetical protein
MAWFVKFTPAFRTDHAQDLRSKFAALLRLKGREVFANTRLI